MFYWVRGKVQGTKPAERRVPLALLSTELPSLHRFMFCLVIFGTSHELCYRFAEE